MPFQTINKYISLKIFIRATSLMIKIRERSIIVKCNNLFNPSHPGGGGGGTLAPTAGFLTAVPKPLWVSV